MKHRIEYLDYDLANNLTKPCGDRSTVVLDGRNSISTMIADAHNFNGFRRPHYPAFRIFKNNNAVYEWGV